MTRELVVARYKEDVGWVYNLPEQFVATIYNKGGLEATKTHRVNVEAIPNHGNEAHTYLYHIIANYSSLADYTIFCQARYDDHDRDFLSNIYSNDEFKWLSHWELESLADGRHHHGGLHPDYFYAALFHKRSPETFWFGQGGMHLVSKERILSKPRWFYKRAISLVLGGFRDFEPWCCLERMWKNVYYDEAYE